MSRPKRAPQEFEKPDMDVRIETIGPIQVTRFRHVGTYAEVGPRLEQLFRWASAIGVPTGRVITLSWDDPAVDEMAAYRRFSGCCGRNPIGTLFGLAPSVECDASSARVRHNLQVAL